jgi:hypothetical protein
LTKGKEQMTFAAFKEKIDWVDTAAVEAPVDTISDDGARGAQGGYNPGYYDNKPDFWVALMILITLLKAQDLQEKNFRTNFGHQNCQLIM